MMTLAIRECLGGFCTNSSQNWGSEEFHQALGLYLQGKEEEALGILGVLEARYRSRQASPEYSETVQLQVSCLLASGDLTEAAERGRFLLDLATTSCDARLSGLAMACMALISAHQGHADYSIDLGNRAKELLTSSGDIVDVARVCSTLGYAFILRGNYFQAQRELETAANLAKASRAPAIHGAACRRLALCHVKQADFAAARRSYSEALKVYENIRATWCVAQIHFSLGSLHCLLGETGLAEVHIDLSESADQDLLQGLTLHRIKLLRAWLLTLKGEEAETIAALSEILPHFIENNSQRDEALCHEFLGDAHRGLGDYEKAHQHYDAGLEKGRMVSVTSDVVLECLRKSAELYLDEGNIGQCLVRLRQALKLARKTGDHFEHACLLRLKGKMKHLRGQRGVALRILEQAWNRFRSMGASVEANRTADAMADLLRLDGKAEEARVWARLAGARNAPDGSDMRGIPRGSRLSKDMQLLAVQAREAGIVSADPRILNSFRLAVRAAGSHLPALILGETGSGKELFASTIHAYSQARGSFVPVNCAALPGDILDAELFGHSRGAFTGAIRDRAGLIESAAGGTLFLDEIGEMALPVQGRLLRALELGEIRRLGESQPRKVSTRFIAATHRNLEEMVRKGTFRADLFFRLKGIVIPVPPLRERAWDVDLLVDHFLASMSRYYRRRITLTDEARERLQSHPWPGNVRELKSVIERLVSLNDSGTVIGIHDLGIGEVRFSVSLEEHLEAEEKRRLTAILESVQWNKSAAARILKMKRTTLLGKLKRLGINTPPRR